VLLSLFLEKKLNFLNIYSYNVGMEIGLEKMDEVYTCGDYCFWHERWEIIDGSSLDFSSMPSKQHQSIINQIYDLMIELIRVFI
jgi:hypothetical protein